MVLIPLGNVAKVLGGFAFKSDKFVDSGIPVVRITNIIDGKVDVSIDPVYYPQETLNQYKDYQLQDGDVLIAMSGATTGKIGRVKKEQTPLLLNQRVGKFLIRDTSILNDYLHWVVRSPHYQKALWNYAAGCAQPNVSSKQLESIKIHLPALSVQRKIASILEKAESAREKRKQANRLTDEFLKSAFLEMFGDPARNPKKWPIKRFDEIYTSIRYAIGSPPEYKKQGIPFIRATNIKNGTVIMKDMKYISLDDAEQIEKCKLSHGNLVIVRSGVNAGDCALIPEEFDGSYAAYDLIVEVPFSSAVFYNHLINSTFGKTMIAPLKRRAGQPHLNAEQIGSLKFIAPSLSEQQKFADLAQKVEKLKEKQSESENELNNLFNSLMQRAFRGEIS
jgi:type I restriction enzyme S subunit